MKTKPHLMIAALLSVAACDNRNPQRTSLPPVDACVVENGSPLSTILPPEQWEGTPAPIQFAGVPARLVPPRHALGPGTLGVRYGWTVQAGTTP